MSDQCKARRCAPRDFLKAVMLTSQQVKTELGRDCPFFSGKQGCPLAHAKDILSPYNAAVSVSQLWQLECTSCTGNSFFFFHCAYDSAPNFVCLVLCPCRASCASRGCVLGSFFASKTSPTHELSFIGQFFGISLWSLEELDAKRPVPTS